MWNSKWNCEGNLFNFKRGSYGQYRASLALVPCDGQAISVFTEPQISEKEDTVSVIFVYDKPVEDLKRWLE